MKGRLAPVLMVQGTASHVGKSTLVTALCRILRQDGLRVAPFKAQNMALNSYVAVEGGEIGRSQAVQAEAAGVDASVDMNPILLKPEGDTRAQIVVNGRAVGRLSATEYQTQKLTLWPVVTAALDRLRARYDVVVAEGAGSPAEINLKHSDLANMRVAIHAKASVMLVGDIDRGGVFASLLGTLQLLPNDERALIVGLAINKFRGDLSILAPGVKMLEERAGVPVLGVVPYLGELGLPEEDSLGLPRAGARRRTQAIDVVVIRLPRVANFDELGALAREPSLALRYVELADDLGSPRLIILPGTKSTVADLEWLRASGLSDSIVAARGNGVPIVGICGGYQMLGRLIRDPYGAESDRPETPGLALLPVVTTFSNVKTTRRVSGVMLPDSGPLGGAAGRAVVGYEIHMGMVEIDAPLRPLISLRDECGSSAISTDGVISDDGIVVGTLCHGLFGNDAVREALVGWLHERSGNSAPARVDQPDLEQRIDQLANVVRSSLNVEALRRACGIS